VAQVLDVLLQHEALHRLEGETDLLMKGKTLKGLEVLVQGALHE
jgi:hypothetical protein